VGLVGFAIVAVVAGLALSSSSDDPGGGSGGTDVTDPAKFDLPTLDGTGRVRLADFEGKPVVVNFFASWCEPCKKELPEFTAAARQLAGKVAFVGVNSKEITAPAGVALARSMGLADAGITLARDVGPGSSALNDRYDAAGIMKYVAAGQLTKDMLSAQLQELYGVAL
jgi:cytochrome c biogenesis protein CcmG/thiol:disulfide interchange protein DsbE